ncbi:tRNA (cytidine(34)-2'-O)-methyltransferase-like protein [Trifolium pratense]|uniref:tRNA (Cytidine(34)-2'-O)-methyltransferase-like protein n=1 Tax=Trifolium pratense TaxID=57577 RepID=A0A2K3L227_TRIPR|nr:tRNA (cytidine(34)-2'-O)-methyltransferase-like protein [Trifolium pratense]
MDIPFSSALKSLNSLAAASNPFHFRSKLSLFRHTSPFPSISISSPRFSPLSSLSNGSATAAAEISKEGSLPQGVGQGINESSHSKILQVVLVSPQIPGNTGCIARTCAASAVGLHLVGPLGYKVDDTKLKRAGLDYWPVVLVLSRTVQHKPESNIKSIRIASERTELSQVVHKLYSTSSVSSQFIFSVQFDSVERFRSVFINSLNIWSASIFHLTVLISIDNSNLVQFGSQRISLVRKGIVQGSSGSVQKHRIGALNLYIIPVQFGTNHYQFDSVLPNRYDSSVQFSFLNRTMNSPTSTVVPNCLSQFISNSVLLDPY